MHVVHRYTRTPLYIIRSGVVNLGITNLFGRTKQRQMWGCAPTRRFFMR